MDWPKMGVSPRKYISVHVYTESTCIIYPDYITCAPKTMPKSRVSDVNCEQFIELVREQHILYDL